MEGERALALSYASPAAREGLEALLALDDRLAAIVRAARDPIIGAMRLTWWADALEALDGAPPPAEPVLTGVARSVLRHGVTGAALAGMVDGWERLLDLGDLDLPAFAAERGGRLFGAAATVLGASDPRVAALGEGWALARLVPDRDDARALAEARLRGAFALAWPRPLRSLGALGLIARFDLDGAGPPGSARRVGRLLWHRLTGR